MVLATFAEFFAPQSPLIRATDFIHVPPQGIHFFGEQGFRPFVYGLTMAEDPRTWRKIYTNDTTVERPIRFFVHGEPYKMWGIFPSDIHLFGTTDGPFYLLGIDDSGRDMLSRIIYGIRISVSIGLVGVIFTLTRQSNTYLENIAGNVPVPLNPPQQCGFTSRCLIAEEGLCDRSVPPLEMLAPGHQVRCFLAHTTKEETILTPTPAEAA